MGVTTKTTKKKIKGTGEVKTFKYFQVPYVDHTGKRRTRTFKRKADATAFDRQVPLINHVHKSSAQGGSAAAALNTVAALGQVPVDESTIVALQRSEVDRTGTLEKWVEEFLAASRDGRDGGNKIEESSIRAHARYLSYATERFGNRQAAGIVRDEFIDLRDWLAKERTGPNGRKLSEGTIAGTIRSLKCLYGWKIATGKMSGLNPLRKLTAGKKEKDSADVQAVTEEMIHTPAEVDQILALMDRRVGARARGRFRFGDIRNRAMILTGLYTGLRNGEIRALQWKHVDFENSIILVRRSADIETNKIGDVKTPLSRRTVAMHPRVIDALKTLRDYRPGHDEARQRAPVTPESFVFGTEEDNSVIDYHATVKAWKRVQKDAGVTVRNFHSMRHYYASMMFAKGRDERVVSKMLGHHSVEFTAKVYVHLIDKQQRILHDVEDIKNVFD